MTARQSDLFAKPPRKPRRVMMRAIDIGHPGARLIARFRCACGHVTGWLVVASMVEAKRGEPCPICNSSPH